MADALISYGLKVGGTGPVVAHGTPPAAAAPAGGGVALMPITTGLTSTGYIAVADTATIQLLNTRMPACTVKNFRFQASSHGDPINILVTNQTKSTSLAFDATNAGNVMGEEGLAFDAEDLMLITATNSAPGESGTWHMTGVLEVHFA